MYEKIRNDTFRTLATDPLFRRRVTENSLTRVLNAVSWQLHDAHEARVNGWQSPPSIGLQPPLSFSGSPDAQGESPAALRFGREMESDAGGSVAPSQETSIGYVQGMNVLAAPFLYAARSEVQAFAAYSHFITTICPGYVRGGSMDGVHRGLTLVDRILDIVDPKLSAHLQSRHLSASIYAFASVLTLCACTPPLPEVLKLWDFLFAFGPHLNLVCIVAQLIMIRDKLLSSDRYAQLCGRFGLVTHIWYSPNQILRAMPPLDADQIKAVAISLIRHIPESLFEEIVSHAT